MNDSCALVSPAEIDFPKTRTAYSSSVQSLYEVYLLAHGDDEPTFVARHRNLYLVKRPALADPIVDEDTDPDLQIDIPTALITRKTDSSQLRDSTADAGEWRIAQVGKRPGFPPFNRVVLGRATVCDLVLPFNSVSRSHAQFHIESQRVTGLTDKGSQNGTFVNGSRLPSGEVATVAPGDEIRFGDIACVLLDGMRLYTLLRSM